MSEQKQPERMSWLGQDIPYTCLLGLAWAWQQGPRLRELGLGRAEQQLLESLAAHTDFREDTGQSFPPQTLIAEETGMSLSGLRQALHNLKASGVIEAMRIKGRCNQYRILPERDGHVWRQIHPVDVTSHPLSGSVTSSEWRSHIQSVDLSHPLSSPKDVQVKSTGKRDKENAPPVTVPIDLPLELETGKQEPVDRERIDPVETKNSVIRFGGPNPVKPKPAQPRVEPARTKEQELALWFWELIRSPKREKSAALSTWPTTVARLLSITTEDRLREVLTWADEHAYWGTALRRLKGDSMEHLWDSWDEIVDQYEQAQRRAATKPTKTGQHPVPENFGAGWFNLEN